MQDRVSYAKTYGIGMSSERLLGVGLSGLGGFRFPKRVLPLWGILDQAITVLPTIETLLSVAWVLT